MAVQKVHAIPDATKREMPKDPWFDAVLDGELTLVDEATWRERYQSLRSAQSSIRQAAENRGQRVSIQVRGQDLYILAAAPKTAPDKGKPSAAGTKAKPVAPAKKVATKATTPAKKAAPKRAARPRAKG